MFYLLTNQFFTLWIVTISSLSEFVLFLVSLRILLLSLFLRNRFNLIQKNENANSLRVHYDERREKRRNSMHVRCALEINLEWNNNYYGLGSYSGLFCLVTVAKLHIFSFYFLIYCFSPLSSVHPRPKWKFYIIAIFINLSLLTTAVTVQNNNNNNTVHFATLEKTRNEGKNNGI